MMPPTGNNNMYKYILCVCVYLYKRIQSYIYIYRYKYNYNYILQLTYINVAVSWHFSPQATLAFFKLSKVSGAAFDDILGSSGIPTPLKNMSSSVGMITFPTYGKIKFMFQTTNQIIINLS